MIMITNGNLQVLPFLNGREMLGTFCNIERERGKYSGTVRVIIGYEKPMFFAAYHNDSNFWCARLSLADRFVFAPAW